MSDPADQPAARRRPRRSLRGQLLVANPAMPDRNFHRTVVLVLEHTDEGAAGVVLNHATDATLGTTMPGRWDLAARAAPPAVFFVGGPVEQHAAICLAEVTGVADGEEWRRLVGQVGTLNLDQSPDLLDRVRRLRLFFGYAGWDGGQLETELSAGAWIVAGADPEDVMTPSPGELWRAVLRRQRGTAPALANFPANPRLN